MFNYKDFLSVKQEDQRTYSLSPQSNLESIFQPFQDKDNTKEPFDDEFDEESPLKPDLSDKKADVSDILKKLNIKSSSEEAKTEAIASKRKSKRTERILASIREKSFKKLNRSYALLEFFDYADKEKALIPEMRVFGMKIGGNMLITDDADYKLTLICNNVHWGASLERFCEKINDEFGQKNALGSFF